MTLDIRPAFSHDSPRFDETTGTPGVIPTRFLVIHYLIREGFVKNMKHMTSFVTLEGFLPDAKWLDFQNVK